MTGVQTCALPICFPVTIGSVLFDGTAVNDFLGYNPRYWPWKSKIDRIHGAFTTTLKDWVAPIDDDYLHTWFSSKDGKAASVSWPFFKVNPNTLDSIFAVAADSIWETDQLLVNCDVSSTSEILNLCTLKSP